MHPTALLDSIAPDDRAPLARRLRFLLDALPPDTGPVDAPIRRGVDAAAELLDPHS